jgi:hypothetical protein
MGGLDDMEKRKFLTLPGFELRPIGRPARRQSPYPLRYPGSHVGASTSHNPMGLDTVGKLKISVGNKTRVVQSVTVPTELLVLR